MVRREDVSGPEVEQRRIADREPLVTQGPHDGDDDRQEHDRDEQVAHCPTGLVRASAHSAARARRARFDDRHDTSTDDRPPRREAGTVTPFMAMAEA